MLQGILAVAGMGFLTQSLAGRSLVVRDVIEGVFTFKGTTGAVLLVLSSFVMFFALTFSKLSEYVPVSTGAAYFFTVLYAVTLQGERVTIPIVLGMVMIVGGIAIISSQK